MLKLGLCEFCGKSHPVLLLDPVVEHGVIGTKLRMGDLERVNYSPALLETDAKLLNMEWCEREARLGAAGATDGQPAEKGV